MAKHIHLGFSASIPQNLIIKKPLIGSLMVGLFCFLFALVYRPQAVHPGYILGFAWTMAIYSAVIALSLFFSLLMFKRMTFFRYEEEWTSGKELLVVAGSILAAGIAVYLTAFLVEPPANRLNLGTLLNSIQKTLLAVMLPFATFTLVNLRFWLYKDQAWSPMPNKSGEPAAPAQSPRININSQLKKENLEFSLSEFLYAESDGNYVVFYLQGQEKIRKVMIRTTINSVAEQLSSLPGVFRTHRTFIANLGHMISCKGNSLGYSIRIRGIEKSIPVSRGNAAGFARILRQRD